ncbi:uncharacterized protein Dsimw501_GD28261 [Drosophila simulans]|uniref:Uncharacterized protein n=1 Tax=Drosophila simulans TaxID=7240 RepID=A0A0J9RXK9_DROSI|nr:uncharacterized protein Dsimw501_GD28261 [Drosophila simulans]
MYICSTNMYVQESGPVQQTPLNSIRSNDTSPGPTIRTQPHFLLRAYVHPCRPNISLSLSLFLPFAFEGRLSYRAVAVVATFFTFFSAIAI